MEEFVTYISTLNTSTWFIIGSLVTVAGLIMNHIVDSKLMTSMFMLAFQGGAIILNFLAQKYAFGDYLFDPETNLIAFSTVGMMIALVVSLMLMRMVNGAADASRPKITR